jgi:hypothetical protein
MKAVNNRTEFRKILFPDAFVNPRFRWILWPRKLQDSRILFRLFLGFFLADCHFWMDLCNVRPCPEVSLNSDKAAVFHIVGSEVQIFISDRHLTHRVAGKIRCAHGFRFVNTRAGNWHDFRLTGWKFQTSVISYRHCLIFITYISPTSPPGTCKLLKLVITAPQ